MVQVQIYAFSIAMAHHPVKYDTVLWKKMPKSTNSSVKCTRKSIHKDCAAKSHAKPNNSMLCKVFGSPSLRTVLQKAA